jgi:TolB protein
MQKLLISLFFVFASSIYAEELEVHLSTQISLPQLYISPITTDPSEFDWRYFEDLRAVLQFDLSTCGLCSLLPPNLEWNHALQSAPLSKQFNLSFWKMQKVPFVLTLEVFENHLYITAFQVEKETFKKYPGYRLSGQMGTDRKNIHRLADAIQKDLFGLEGISSLQLIYTQRIQNPNGNDPEWLSEIWLSDVDGANARQITNEQNYCLSPAFLPTKQNGADFYFISYKGGQSKIYKASFNNPKPEPMVVLRGSQLLPSLSKKGTQMAFIADTAGRPDLFIQYFDTAGRMIGKARQLFSAPRATQASPTFSPDGRQIAFVSDKDGPPRIYVLEITSPKETKKIHPRVLTKKNRENTSPSWSPDGKRLAYSAKTEGIRQIWLYDFETDEETQLTMGPDNKENPAWAPNSFHLVYNTENETSCEIYQINLEQKTPILISKGMGQKRFPSWEPRF